MKENKIGCLIENPALYMDMTARQILKSSVLNLEFGEKSSIDEVLEIMDLKDAGNKKSEGFFFRDETAIRNCNCIAWSPTVANFR